MTTPHRTTPGEWRDGLEETLESFDETGGHRVLSRVFDELGVEDALSLVVLPYLHDVGERWSAGSIGVAQEHFASHVLRSRLSVLMEAPERADGPLAVLACMPGEHHEFGLMATAIVLSRLGWRSSYLGANTPTAELAHTCRMLRPAAVVVAAHRSTAFAAHAPALRRLAGSTTVHLAAHGATDEVAELCGASSLHGDPVWAARALHEAHGRSTPDVAEPTAV
ncbi:cobalamin B12-binding domain-containing protein [Terrabacter sp. 2YAF2]|uniref:cobalamin B12-binding domain-containing protein n=1 Tax=Terrabacter sp. 2YAF2 TaxID=3233026 RepID=UPI003F9E86FB